MTTPISEKLAAIFIPGAMEVARDAALAENSPLHGIFEGAIISRNILVGSVTASVVTGTLAAYSEEGSFTRLGLSTVAVLSGVVGIFSGKNLFGYSTFLFNLAEVSAQERAQAAALAAQAQDPDNIE